MAELEKADVPVAPVNGLLQVYQDPQVCVCAIVFALLLLRMNASGVASTNGSASAASDRWLCQISRCLALLCCTMLFTFASRVGIPVKYSETPGKIRLPPPLLGQHTKYARYCSSSSAHLLPVRSVLQEVLGLDVPTLQRLAKDGVISMRDAP